ncbi:MAG: SAM-dependent chlorinase/fluorinase, partial [Clostridia bacterium]|nr:SAM-dependent chlorinase/fluorinase [Clostridia bacterium]
MDGAPIALLTDFGPSEYVGVVKGVLAGLAPRVPVIDLTHAVLPQNVRQGAWLLAACAPSFPAGTVFCAVVDPGVGSERAALVVRGRRYVFVGPDNGLLYPA